MKKIFFLIIICLSVNAHAQKTKKFYGESNVKTGISGDYELLTTERMTKSNVYGTTLLGAIVGADLSDASPVKRDYSIRYYHNDVEIPDGLNLKMYTGAEIEMQLNDEQVGWKILKYLYQWDGNSCKNDLIEQRVEEYLHLRDIERGEQNALNITGKEIAKEEEELTILQKNYIYIENNSRWMVFHVDITKQIYDQVMVAWNNPEKFSQIKVPVSFVAKGKVGNGKKLMRRLSKKVPALAIRGEVTQKHPFVAAVGSSDGLKKRDRMFIYRQYQDKQGEFYSKKISTVRVGGISVDSVKLYTIAGGHASAKKGDIAVLKPDRKTGYSLTGNYQDHSYGLNYTLDWMLGFSSNGWSDHLLFSIGSGLFSGNDNTLYAADGVLYNSPVYYNAGIGYGKGYTFAHRMQIMPYFMGQFEGLNTEVKEKHNGMGTPCDFYYSVRVPVGLRFNINLWYPIQLSAGAEYIFNISWDEDKEWKPKTNSLGQTLVSEKQPMNYSYFENVFLKPNGWKRSGVNLYVGLRFAL